MDMCKLHVSADLDTKDVDSYLLTSEKDDRSVRNRSLMISDDLGNSKEDLFDEEDGVQASIMVNHTGTLKTPSSIYKFSKNIVSSTPMTSSKRFRINKNNARNSYKTPENKRVLFQNNFSNYSNSSLTSSTNKTEYFPVSSPTSSELVKLNCSKLLSDDCSTFCNNLSCSFNDSVACVQANSESGLNNTGYKNKSSDLISNQVVDIKLCYRKHKNISNGSNISLDTSDMLSGIMPLNENDL